jgi:hypothetical protein
MGAGLMLRAEIGPHPHPGVPRGAAQVLAKDTTQLWHAPLVIKHSHSKRGEGQAAGRFVLAA